MTRLLYLTENKPSRKASQQFIDWLRTNYPECWFVEINAGKRSHPPQNGGRYLGKVEGPETWGDADHASDREVVYTTACSMLAS
jgi:hypothetical protein